MVKMEFDEKNMTRVLKKFIELSDEIDKQNIADLINVITQLQRLELTGIFGNRECKKLTKYKIMWEQLKNNMEENKSSAIFDITNHRVILDKMDELEKKILLGD
jgi:hypothetical protein